jgi:hypothetical protein
MEDEHSSPIDDKTFNSAQDHFALFRLPAIIRQGKYKVETGKPFKTVDLQGKLGAVELLEKTAVPFAPLRACVVS